MIILARIWLTIRPFASVTEIKRKLYLSYGLSFFTSMGIERPERMMENMALIKSAEVCEMLGISTAKLRVMTTEKKIPAYRIGRNYRYDRGEIEEWLKEQKLAPADTEHEEAASADAV